MFLRCALAVCCFCRLVAGAAAAEPADKEKPQQLVITSAVEPRPALKYQLLPKFIDCRSGNAAPRYGKAIIHRPPNPEFDTKVAKWLDLPASEFSKSETRKEVTESGLTTTIDLLRLAARLESCDWELPLHEQMPYSILLPEVQDMRRMSGYVALQARLQLAEKKFAEAIDTLSVGYAMGRHVAQGPTLINGLVGLVIAGRMDKVALEMAQTPEAPSLFWAATFQPRPLVDVRPGLEGEMYSLVLGFPSLRSDAQSEEEWKAEAQRLVRDFGEIVETFADDGDDKSWLGLFRNVAVSGKIAMRREPMQKFLTECGRDRDVVGKMSDSQLFLEYSLLKYEDLRDEMFRWMALPYPEARRGIEAAEQRLKSSKKLDSVDHEIVPFAALFLPAVAQVSKTAARAERRSDVVRVVEALRLYAGKHEGRLPPTLGEIEGLPLPKLDAVTGKPFHYVLDGDTARLTLPEERNGDDTTLVYEIRVAK
ncbi:MAG: hypothetical protein QM775_30215 [Pirellulales bacterium]